MYVNRQTADKEKRPTKCRMKKRLQPFTRMVCFIHLFKKKNFELMIMIVFLFADLGCSFNNFLDIIQPCLSCSQ